LFSEKALSSISLESSRPIISGISLKIIFSQIYEKNADLAKDFIFIFSQIYLKKGDLAENLWQGVSA
jgi:hypothetical protein